MALTHDQLIQTDITKALQAFATTPEQKENWHGFALYCMCMASSVIHDFKSKTRSDPEVFKIAELKRFNRWQSSITLRDIQHYTNGTMKLPDFNTYTKAISNANVITERDNFKTQLDEANKRNEDEKLRVTQLKTDFIDKVQALERQSLLSTESQTRLDLKVREAVSALQERETTEKNFFLGLGATLEQIKSGITDASIKQKVEDTMTVLNLKLASTTSLDPVALQSRIADLNKKIDRLEMENAQKDGEIAQLKRDRMAVSNETKLILKSIAEKCDVKSGDVNKINEMIADTDNLGSLTTDFTGDVGQHLIEICKKMRILGKFLYFYRVLETEGVIKFCETHFTECQSFLDTEKLFILSRVFKAITINPQPFKTLKTYIDKQLKGSSYEKCKKIELIMKNMDEDECINTSKISDLSQNNETSLIETEKSDLNASSLTNLLAMNLLGEMETFFSAHVCTLMLLLGHAIIEKYPRFRSHLECIRNIILTRVQFNNKPINVYKLTTQALELNITYNIIGKLFTDKNVQNLKFPICLFSEGFYIQKINANNTITITTKDKNVKKNSLFIKAKFTDFFQSFGDEKTDYEFDFDLDN